MKKCSIILIFSLLVSSLSAQQVVSWKENRQQVILQTTEGEMCVRPLAKNAVRIRHSKQNDIKLPEWVYLDSLPQVIYSVEDNEDKITIVLPEMSLNIDKATGKVDYYNMHKKSVLAEENRQIRLSSIQGEETYAVEQSFLSPTDEYLYGLGQFQDGYLNIKGLSRRLTQVNTQISIPFILSNKGYGLLWNNYGLTEFNPSDEKVILQKTGKEGLQQVVDVTSTEGTRQEVRESNQFTATFTVAQKGKYALLLDVGQSMARRHNLAIDGRTVIEMNNFWLPPTASVIVELEAGAHTLTSEMTKDDRPVLYYKLVDNRTTFRSPVAESIDYTVFVGNADAVISAYRKVTGEAPMMPLWALGYIHCRERFHSSDEILNTAQQFRKEQLPLDIIVQDWQYWGKYGWNAMRFDEEFYPDPKQLVDELHQMNVRFMVSVWSKIDPQSEVGKQMTERGYYIPNTSWIDFFNSEASNFYWKNFSKRLLMPYQIDAWWQDATEPENDDLCGRKVLNQTIPGEVYRNIYPLFVNKTIYEGCRADDPSRRTMILTRCGFSGMQRYGAATWSGDVGHDWETLRRQITAGLGYVSTGLPWWTFDAGGFFRPGQSQYTDTTYHERFLRWLQISTFLPLMRVHGYMTNTEFWNYGDEVVRVARQSLDWRYRLLPYIYSQAAAITFRGSTLMRPLVMDYANDQTALNQKYEYMFGSALLVAPIVEPNPRDWSIYLPENKGGWFDFWTNEHFSGGLTHQVKVSKEYIPVFVKAGSIVPLGSSVQNAEASLQQPLEIRIYPGANAEFILYEDEGDNYNYEKGAYSTIKLQWNDQKRELTINSREGKYKGMKTERELKIVDTNGKTIETVYKGKKLDVKL